MRIKNVKTFFTLLSLTIILMACGLPASGGATEVPGTEAPIVEVAATQEATQESSPSDQPVSVQHQTIPENLPDDQSGQATDFDSSKSFENGTLIGGDRFTYERFERPFNANTMDTYFSQIDIVDTRVYQDDIWIFGSITLQGLTASSSSNEKYALELDTNLDGKGDWLILAVKPASTDWSVNGVQVYEDANNDVGLELPTLTDEHATNGDGFEVLAFDQGQGNDPDAAWARISPNDENVIDIAVKQSALGDPEKYLINMWAGTSILNPAIFDLNDEFTHEQAGAADEGLEFFYPIKGVAEIDNSCRMAVGFQPDGSEPGLCPLPQQQGSPVAPGASCPANTFSFCTNGSCFCSPILIFIPVPPPEPPR
jgi:hypothetical protein